MLNHHPWFLPLNQRLLRIREEEEEWKAETRKQEEEEEEKEEESKKDFTLSLDVPRRPMRQQSSTVPFVISFILNRFPSFNPLISKSDEHS